MYEAKSSWTQKGNKITAMRHGSKEGGKCSYFSDSQMLSLSLPIEPHGIIDQKLLL